MELGKMIILGVLKHLIKFNKMCARSKILSFLTIKMVFLLLFLFPKENFAQDLDTALIHELKNFFYRETGFTLKGDFFIKWDNKQQYLLFVSLPDRIESPPEMKKYDETRDDDTASNTEKKKLLPENNDYQVMRYDVPADAGCAIRPEFPDYSSDGLAFVIFHELMHNYIRQKKIRIPYIYEEAVCDIMGDYCTLKFAENDKRISRKAAIIQIRVNDNIYSSVNRCIAEIFEHPENIASAHKKYGDEIHQSLKKGNEFQKFRMGYEVNNAFLLKCRNYSWNYFILKKIFLEQKSIKDFVDVIAGLSDISDNRSPALENYQMELFRHTNWFIEVTIDWDDFTASLNDSNVFYIGVFDRDPINVYVNVLNQNADSLKITPEVCMADWNEIIKGFYNKAKPKNKNFLLTSNSMFGKAWLVTTAFQANGHTMCWCEEVHLQMGKTINVTLSKDNTTYIEFK